MKKSIYTKRHERLCEVLKAARLKADLTQVVLAKRLGAYETYVTKYENGDRMLDVIEFIDVAEALGVDPTELLRKVKA